MQREHITNGSARRVKSKALRGWSIEMKVKMYTLIQQIVESGVDAGFNRAHKHTDTPIEETIKSCIEEYIMSGFDEHFTFEHEEL